MLEKASRGENNNYHQRTSKMGYDFDDSDNVWILDNTIKINWKLLPEDINPKFIKGYKEQMGDYAEELSASTCKIIFSQILEMLRKTEEKEITISTVQNYLSKLDDRSEWKLGSIRAFLLNWIDKKIGGIDPKVESFLEEITLKGIIKGVPVSNGCPHSGAFSMQEQEAILRWSVNAFMDNLLSLRDYTWLMLNLYLGARPTQFCQLKAGDLNIIKSNGETKYTLQVPKAKKRGAKNFRDSFNVVDIDEDLALLFSNQVKATQNEIEKKVGVLPEDIVTKLPVFADKMKLMSINSIDMLLTVLQEKRDYIHLNRNYASKLMFLISIRCDARSERLNGEYIHLTARRFRYTLGTNAARRGLSPYSIAKILTHSDIQNTKIYTENVKELTEEFDEVLAPVLAPLAQAFAGQLIVREADAIRVNDPLSRIHNRNGDGVGNCGSYGFCASGGRACYTCAKFQPWVHGRHQAILDDLLNDRKRLRDRGASSYVLQSTDRLVLAITEVIQLCEIAKNEGLVNA